jgi:hypothetical protein
VEKKNRGYIHFLAFTGMGAGENPSVTISIPLFMISHEDGKKVLQLAAQSSDLAPKFEMHADADSGVDNGVADGESLHGRVYRDMAARAKKLAASGDLKGAEQMMRVGQILSQPPERNAGFSHADLDAAVAEAVAQKQAALENKGKGWVSGSKGWKEQDQAERETLLRDLEEATRNHEHRWSTTGEGSAKGADEVQHSFTDDFRDKFSSPPSCIVGSTARRLMLQDTAKVGDQEQPWDDVDATHPSLVGLYGRIMFDYDIRHQYWGGVNTLHLLHSIILRLGFKSGYHRLTPQLAEAVSVNMPVNPPLASTAGTPAAAAADADADADADANADLFNRPINCDDLIVIPEIFPDERKSSAYSNTGARVLKYVLSDRLQEDSEHPLPEDEQRRAREKLAAMEAGIQEQAGEDADDVWGLQCARSDTYPIGISHYLHHANAGVGQHVLFTPLDDVIYKEACGVDTSKDGTSKDGVATGCRWAGPSVQGGGGGPQREGQSRRRRQRL